MVVWRGMERFKLSSSDLKEVSVSPSSQRKIVEGVRNDRLLEWAQVILLETSPGQKVLGIGAGTGEISLHLAWAGRRVTALDISDESLEFIHRCAAELGGEIETVQADATKPLLFNDNEFDCVVEFRVVGTFHARWAAVYVAGATTGHSEQSHCHGSQYYLCVLQGQ